MLIKKATVNEINLLCTISIQTYREHFSHIWSQAGMEKYLKTHFNHSKLKMEINDSRIMYFFILENEMVIGYIKLILEIRSKKSLYENAIKIDKIYLLNDFTGKGYGAKMLDFITETARQNDFFDIWLEVLRNNKMAILFYEKKGFLIVGVKGFSTDKTSIGMWIMKKTISRQAEIGNT